MKSYTYYLVGYHKDPKDSERAKRYSTQCYKTLCDCQMSSLLNITDFARQYPSIGIIEVVILGMENHTEYQLYSYTFDVSNLENSIVSYTFGYFVEDVIDASKMHSISLKLQRNPFDAISRQPKTE